MAKISDLDAVPVTLTGTETLALVQDGVTYRATALAIAALGGGGGSYTDEQVRDVIGASLVAGSNITLNVDDAADTITISASGGGGYTDEEVRDVIGASLVAGANITLDVDDAGDTITISAAGGAGGGSYTDEEVRDVVGATLVGGDYINIVVNDANDTITISAAGSGGGSAVEFDVNGNLGIGTATPAKRLHIVDPSTNEGTLNLGSNATYFGSIKYNYGAGAIVLGTGVAQGEFFASFQGHFYPGGDAIGRCGIAANRWDVIFAASGAISTSDERAKQEIGPIPDAWLDAWAQIEWQKFKFVDGTRWHIGLIAQQVHSVFAAHGIDAFEIGLCCYDSWDEEADAEGNVTRAAGDRWGLRYEECLALEAAWNRRELHDIRAKMSQMES